VVAARGPSSGSWVAYQDWKDAVAGYDLQAEHHFDLPSLSSDVIRGFDVSADGTTLLLSGEKSLATFQAKAGNRDFAPLSLASSTADRSLLLSAGLVLVESSHGRFHTAPSAELSNMTEAFTIPGGAREISYEPNARLLLIELANGLIWVVRVAGVP